MNKPASHSDQIIRLTGRLRVPRERLEEIKGLLDTHIALTREEAGCLSFNVTQSQRDSEVFEVNEAFRDKKAFDYHQGRVEISEWGLKTRGLIREYELSDSYYMYRALELAREAREKGEVPVGALVVRNGEIIGEGYNQPISARDPSAHAEILALRLAAQTTGNYRLPGTTLYCTIEPCSMCAGALIHARVSRLVYGAPEPRAGAVESCVQLLENKGLNHRVEVGQKIMQKACADIISDFFRDKRQDVTNPVEPDQNNQRG